VIDLPTTLAILNFIVGVQRPKIVLSGAERWVGVAENDGAWADGARSVRSQSGNGAGVTEIGWSAFPISLCVIFVLFDCHCSAS